MFRANSSSVWRWSTPALITACYSALTPETPRENPLRLHPATRNRAGVSQILEFPRDIVIKKTLETELEASFWLQFSLGSSATLYSRQHFT